MPDESHNFKYIRPEAIRMERWTYKVQELLRDSEMVRLNNAELHTQRTVEGMVIALKAEILAHRVASASHDTVVTHKHQFHFSYERERFVLAPYVRKVSTDSLWVAAVVSWLALIGLAFGLGWPWTLPALMTAMFVTLCAIVWPEILYKARPEIVHHNETSTSREGVRVHLDQFNKFPEHAYNYPPDMCLPVVELRWRDGNVYPLGPEQDYHYMAGGETEDGGPGS